MFNDKTENCKCECRLASRALQRVSRDCGFSGSSFIMEEIDRNNEEEIQQNDFAKILDFLKDKFLQENLSYHTILSIYLSEEDARLLSLLLKSCVCCKRHTINKPCLN